MSSSGATRSASNVAPTDAPPANPTAGQLWNDSGAVTLVPGLKIWEAGLAPGTGFWAPYAGMDPTVDEAVMLGSFAIPSATATLAGAAKVPFLQVDIPCSGVDPVELELGVPLSNGAAGIGAGRNCVVSLCDITVGGAPVGLPNSNELLTCQAPANQLGLFHVVKHRELTPPAGVRTFCAYAWVNNTALTGALVFANYGSLDGAVNPAYLRVTRK